MNCEEFRAAVLADAEDAETGRHEQGCGACRAHSEDLRAAQRALSDPTVWEEPPPGLGGQIEALIGNASQDRARGSHKPSWGWLATAAVVAVLTVTAGLVALAGSDSPDWEVAVPATDLAPGAVAVVSGWNEEAGTRMILDVEGLPAAPAGAFYEFWLSDGPIHISAGTFQTGGQIELWSGVSRADYPRLWVTLEPIDEDESPSPITVLDTGRSDA